MNPTLVVRATLANLRREPAHASELVTQLILGEQALVIEAAGAWLRVRGGDDYPGWAPAHSFVEADGFNSVPTLVWTRRYGVLRDGPGAEAGPVCDLVLGSRVCAVPDGEGVPLDVGAAPSSGGVLLPDGSRAWADGEGWIPAADLLRRFPRSPEALVRTALSLRGIPYLWGGTSSKAFDCSGFVQRVFALHGVPLPRDAHEQAEVGVRVEPGAGGRELRAGDLVFFAESGGRIDHVAIALGEAGRLVHSSSRRAGVGTNSLDPSDASYEPGLAESVSGFRRVL